MKKSGQKKPYKKPELIDHGSVQEMTKTTSMGVYFDMGGAPPLDMMAGMCITTLSQLEEHRLLLLDRSVQEKFKKAIDEVVKPGDVVLDLGTGSGIHAMFAVMAGAKKVYAIEADALIDVAKDVAKDNGMADKIEYIYGFSRDIELPEKVDVIITNIGFLNTIRELPDVAKRFLKPGGKTIPQNVYLSFVPVELPEVYDERVNFWEEKQFGLDFSAFKPYAAQYPHYLSSDKKHFISEPQDLTPFKLNEEQINYKWNLEYTVDRDTTLSGFLGWYSFELIDGVTVTTKPPLSISPDIWSQPMLPLKEPVKVKAGTVIKLSYGFYMQATLDDPIWRWDIEIDGKKMPQTNFNAVPLSSEYLKKLQ